jgi:hypothetical protein
MYTYSRNPLVPGGWSRVGAGLTTGILSSHFGATMALNGDASTLVVAAIGEEEDAGALYIYTAPPGTGLWSLQRRISAADAGFTIGSDINFGFTLALSAAGDTLAVGATGTGNEAVVVYVRDGAGVWTNQSGQIKGPRANSLWAWSLAINAAGDGLAIGSAFDNTDGSLAGSVYTTVRSGGVWGPLHRLSMSDAANPVPQVRWLGSSVSMSDQGSLVVGAYEDTPNGGWW